MENYTFNDLVKMLVHVEWGIVGDEISHTWYCWEQHADACNENPIDFAIDEFNEPRTEYGKELAKTIAMMVKLGWHKPRK